MLTCFQKPQPGPYDAYDPSLAALPFTSPETRATSIVADSGTPTLSERGSSVGSIYSPDVTKSGVPKQTSLSEMSTVVAQQGSSLASRSRSTLLSARPVEKVFPSTAIARTKSSDMWLKKSVEKGKQKGKVEAAGEGNKSPKRNENQGRHTLVSSTTWI